VALPAVGFEQVLALVEPLADRLVTTIHERLDLAEREATRDRNDANTRCSTGGSSRENIFCWRAFSTMRSSIVDAPTHPCSAASFTLRLTPFQYNGELVLFIIFLSKPIPNNSLLICLKYLYE
jgi:hypothetical protein